LYIDNNIIIPINLECSTVVKQINSSYVIENEKDLNNGVLNNVQIENNQLFLENASIDYKGLIKECYLTPISLSFKTETGWEFVAKENIYVETLRFLNLSQYKTIRQINIWDVETQSNILTEEAIAEAEKLSWGYVDLMNPVTLIEGRRYIISVSAYNYSVSLKNILSNDLSSFTHKYYECLTLNSNKIEFKCPRYFKSGIGNFPNLKSKHLYALPDIVIEKTNIFHDTGTRLSSLYNVDNNYNKLFIDWEDEVPSNTKVDFFININNEWINVNKEDNILLNDVKFIRTKQLLTSNKFETPKLSNIYLQLKREENFKFTLREIDIYLNNFFNFFDKNLLNNNVKLFINRNEILENSIELSQIKKQFYEENLDLNIDISNLNSIISSSDLSIEINVDSNYANVFNDELFLDVNVDSNVIQVINSEIEDEPGFLFVTSDILRKKKVIIQERWRDFYKGKHKNVVIEPHVGLTLKKHKGRIIKEDFETRKQNFVIKGDWEEEYWDQKRGYIYRSKQISHNKRSMMFFEFNTPINSIDGKLSFDYFVSSQKDKDKLTILINGKKIVQSGDIGWNTISENIKAGYNRVELIYRKDNYDSDYLDRVGIDNILVHYNMIEPRGYRIIPIYDLCKVKSIESIQICYEYENNEDENSGIKIEYGFSKDNLIEVNNEEIITDLNYEYNKDYYLIIKQNLYSNLSQNPILKSMVVKMIMYELFV
jgi:hypothetical protein